MVWYRLTGDNRCERSHILVFYTSLLTQYPIDWRAEKMPLLQKLSQLDAWCWLYVHPVHLRQQVSFNDFFG